MSSVPVVTVVIAVHNAEDYIGEALRSLVSQTYRALEVVVVDDGSTDASVEAVQRVGDSRIRLIRCSANRGQSAARNTGFRAARGRYVAILDSDDVALADRIGSQVHYLDSHPEVGLVGTSYHICNEAGAVSRTHDVPGSPMAILWRLMLSNPIGTPTVMMRREAIDRAGYFDSAFGFAEDLEYWGRVALIARIAQIDAPLTVYRVHDRSLSCTISKVMAAEAAARAHQYNVRRLTGLEIAIDSLMVLAGGAPSSDAELLTVYGDLDALAAAFVRRWPHDAGARRVVFTELSVVLLKLARVNDRLRMRALLSIAHYVREAGLGVGISPALWSLIARVLPPRQVRGIARRIRGSGGARQ